MYPIQSMRLVNMRIPDEKKDVLMRDDFYDLNSEDALLTLANGGGKSSLVLLFSQVFKPNVRRGNRRLKDYVQDEGHSIILVEVNRGTQFATLGLVARKKFFGETDETQSEKLEYFLFIAEYSNQQRTYYGPKQFPIFSDFSSRRLTTYEELESYVKSKPELFHYYKREQRSKYMTYLETQFPNVAAWADTIWEINAVEGGASGKFAVSPKEPDILIPTHQVIKKHLIPVIESKQQIEVDQFKEQLTMVAQKYATEFESEKKRDVLSTFQTNIQSLFLDQTTNVHDLTKRLNEATTTFKGLLARLLPYESYQQKEVLRLEHDYVEAKSRLSEVKVMKLYMVLNNKLMMLTELRDELEKAQSQLDKQTSESEKTKELIQTLKATRYYHRYLEDHQTLLLAQERERVARSENQEKDRELSELRATISKISELLYHDLKTQVSEVEQAIASNKEKRSVSEQERQRLERLVYREEADVKQSEKELKQLKQEISSCWEELNMPTRDLAGNRLSCEEERDDLIHRKDYELGKLEEESENERKQLILRDELKEQVGEQRLVVQQLEKTYRQMKDKRKMLLEKFSEEAPYDQLESFDDRELSIIYQETTSDLERRQKAIRKDIELLDQALSLKREVVIPNEVELWLHEEGIQFVQGIHYLNELSEEECEKFLADYPMMPYSLVLKNPTDLEKIRHYRGKAIESGLLLFMTDPHHYLGEPQTNWWGLGHYPKDFLNPDLWRERCDALEEKHQEFEGQLKVCEQRIRSFATLYARLEECSVARLKRMADSLEEEEGKEDQLTSHLQLQEAICLETKQSVISQRHKVEALTEDLEKVLNQLVMLDRIEKLSQTFKQLQERLEAGEKKCESLREKVLAIKSELEQIGLDEHRFQEQRLSLEQPLSQAKGWYRDYQRFANEQLVLEQHLSTSPLELIQHVEALEREIDLSALLSEIERLSHQCQRSLDDFKEFGVEVEVCEQTTYDEFLLKQYENKLSDLQQELVVCREQVTSLKTKIQLKEDDVDEAKDKFEEAQKKYQANYGEIYLTTEYSLEELREQEKFSKNRSDELESVLGVAVESAKELSRAVKNYRKATTIFPLDQLKIDGTVDFEMMTVEDYLKELDDAESYYRDQETELKESVFHWNRAYQQLWMLDEEARLVLPTGTVKLYSKYPRMETDNYLAVVEAMEKTIGHLQVVIDAENRRLSEADRERDIFVQYIAAQCHEVYDQLKDFDKGLVIQLNEKAQSIMELDVPLLVEPHQFEEAIEEYVKQYIQEAATLMNEIQKSDDFDKQQKERELTQKISSFELATVLTQVVDFEKAILKVLKVTHLGAYLTAWEGDSSGGQGSLKALILIFTIFKYINNNKMGTSIILDNPFGKMSSPQLVETMFKVAQKLKIQLICLTGISETHIQDRFDVHYHLRHVTTKTNKGFLDVQRVKGGGVEMEQAIHHQSLRPTREELKEKVSEQLSLLELMN